jgi:hypothetical protein
MHTAPSSTALPSTIALTACTLKAVGVQLLEVLMAYDPPVPWSPSGPNEQPSTLPKDSQGQAINEDRRERKAKEADFEAKHGRKMSKKDRKRLRGNHGSNP